MSERELILDVWLEWLCRDCGRRQEPVEGEEWPICCDHTMKLQPTKKLSVNVGQEAKRD